jgi:YD repeat-containing protein
VSVFGQGQTQAAGRTGRPRPGKPEGELPNLENIKSESRIERKAPPPIPSTMRSPKTPLEPWNGRRVGDSEIGSKLPVTGERLLASSRRNQQTRRAHARRRWAAPPTVSDDQFVQNFFTWALVRTPSSDEVTFWNDQFRVAYLQGAESVKLAAVAMGKTLFESAQYAARNRDNHWYVYDLYKTFLMRDPDPSGWSYWENLVPAMGRENVRRGFEESSELAMLTTGIVPNGSATANAASLISARVDPRDQPGHGMLARDATWSVALLSLPGRAGLDLGLSLSYSSMVWTRSGPYIHFDEDNGSPSPGFRLGFPAVQRKVFNAQTAKNAYLLISAAGHRVELRQVGLSNVYEAGDSSYLQLTDNGTYLIVRSTDGTQLRLTEINNEYRCTEVKDRNGNYITITYNAVSQITTIVDTLNREIVFNYDGNGNLLSITQSWNGQPSHQWVSFGWATRPLQSSFTAAAVVGTPDNTTLPVITQVALNDGSHFTFDYTNALQVSVIKNYFGTIERNATSFIYDTPAGEVPRLVSSSVSARNWTGINGVPAQVTTQYSVATDGACEMTAPDGTVYSEYYGTGWQRGLTTRSEVWLGTQLLKWTTAIWTQDNTSVGYETNPRVTETNIYDMSGNRRRTVIDYGPYAQYGLPYGVREFAADGETEIRQTYTDYNLSPAYLERRIIGLISYVHVSNVAQWQSKISYSYDDPARLQALPSSATQHDTGYNTAFTARGNVTSVSRWDVTDISIVAFLMSLLLCVERRMSFFLERSYLNQLTVAIHWCKSAQPAMWTLPIVEELPFLELR